MEPVTVLNDESAGEVLVVLREADRDLECAIETEDGERVDGRITLEELASSSWEWYPRPLRLQGRRRPAECLAERLSHLHGQRPEPQRQSAAHRGPPLGARGRFAEGWRAYGLFAPLFSLHSARSWGSGDLSDLDELSRFAAREQASVIATLPLLAGFGPDSFEESPVQAREPALLARTLDRRRTGAGVRLVSGGASSGVRPPGRASGERAGSTVRASTAQP